MKQGSHRRHSESESGISQCFRWWLRSSRWWCPLFVLWLNYLEWELHSHRATSLGSLMVFFLNEYWVLLIIGARDSDIFWELSWRIFLLLWWYHKKFLEKFSCISARHKTFHVSARLWLLASWQCKMRLDVCEPRLLVHYIMFARNGTVDIVAIVSGQGITLKVER